MEYNEALAIIKQLFGNDWKDSYGLFFYGAWHNRTYKQMAKEYNCSNSYLENEGSTFLDEVHLRCGEGAAKITKTTRFRQDIVSCLEELQSGQGAVREDGPSDSSELAPKAGIRPCQLRRNPNRCFVGREQALTRLEEQLTKDSKVAISAVSGMGGIGKTELALQYATDANLRRKYPGGICWLDVRGKNVADEILAFTEAYFSFIPSDKLSLSRQVEVCWNRWFQSFSKSKLVIFDDVVAYEQIKDFLPPQIPSLQVIITTRLRLDAVDIALLNLEVLEEKDSLDLLASYIGEERLQSELSDAKALCKWIGYLPLGLTLVGRYLREFPEDSIDDLLEDLRKAGLAQTAMHEVGIPIGNGQTTADLKEGERRLYESVYAVFNLNWNELRQEGRQLGAILSLFNAPAYTWSLVEKVAPPLAGQRGSARISLKDLHLMHEKEGNPIHSLLQEFFLQKMKEDDNFLGVWDILFDNFIFQQFIYDTGYLDNGLERIEMIRDALPQNAAKGQILLSKMIGHSYYSVRDTGTQHAVENFLNTIAYSQSQDHQLNIERWYQIFAIDHAHNLVVPKGSIEINGEQYSAQVLESMLDDLLPDDLKQLSVPPSVDVAPYILRAGHYWGHRGNQCAFLLFRDIQALSPQKFDSLYAEGIEYYARAVVFRLINFRLGNPSAYERKLQSKLVNAPYLPSWLTDWNESDFQSHDATFEQFTSSAQAIGDTAHQYRGIADIKLWGYLYQAKSKKVDGNFVQEASELVKVTEDLWEAAKILLKNSEKIIKYYLWMANLETKFELIDAHHKGNDLISWEEAESRLIEDLDTLEKEYHLGYQWARRVSMDQLRKFYDTLAELYP